MPGRKSGHRCGRDPSRQGGILRADAELKLKKQHPREECPEGNPDTDVAGILPDKGAFFGQMRN